jgi:penicillin-binding protein-related factor A (putative recombinase)
MLYKYRIECFIIVFSEYKDKFYKIQFEWLRNYPKRSIDFDKIENQCEELVIAFPGIIDFLPKIT